MPRILLVKTSSLGDVVHNLPVASDIAAALPDATIDWVVEEAFAALPGMHSNVSKVIPAAVRRWRKSFWRSATRAEIGALADVLREHDYDAVIDTQGLLKSALIARTARGTRYGLDWRGSREPLGLFYDFTFSVPMAQHAVERNRSLASQALKYRLAPHVDYGAKAQARAFSWLPSDYVVLVHASSAEAKLWPEARWIALARALAARSLSIVLPWGSDDEHRRSERLAESIPQAIVPPRLDLAEMSGLLAGARCAIGVDTGLTHLSGALGRPTVGIYTATHLERHGLYRCAKAVNVGGAGACPEVAEVQAALEHLRV